MEGLLASSLDFGHAKALPSQHFSANSERAKPKLSEKQEQDCLQFGALEFAATD